MRTWIALFQLGQMAGVVRGLSLPIRVGITMAHGANVASHGDARRRTQAQQATVGPRRVCMLPVHGLQQLHMLSCMQADVVRSAALGGKVSKGTCEQMLPIIEPTSTPSSRRQLASCISFKIFLFSLPRSRADSGTSLTYDLARPHAAAFT